MPLFFLLSIVATSIEMTVCLSSTYHLIWRTKQKGRDRSRSLLILGSLVCGIMALFAVALIIITEMLQIPPAMLNPGMGLVYMALHIILTLYPISVVKPGWLTLKRVFILFSPVVFIGLLSLFFTGRWTSLPTPESIWQNLGAPDVLLRLAPLVLMIPYCLILFLLHRNYKYSSASHWWVFKYSMELLLLCGLHIGLMLTLSPTLFIILPVAVAFFFIFSSGFELNERLVPGKIRAEAGVPAAATPAPAEEAPETDLWARICQLMDQEEVWRNPDLSLNSFSRLCATNVTYLSRILRQETGSGFKELVNAKRIASVAAQLKENPEADIQDAFFNAGFRSRTTAWRNFKEIMGISPAEYRASLKQL